MGGGVVEGNSAPIYNIWPGLYRFVTLYIIIYLIRLFQWHRNPASRAGDPQFPINHSLSSTNPKQSMNKPNPKSLARMNANINGKLKHVYFEKRVQQSLVLLFFCAQFF